MPWFLIADGEVDAKSPVSDNVMGKVKADLYYLKSTLSDGAAAAANITAALATLKAAGVALQVDNDAHVDGTLTVGSLVAGSFVIPDTTLHYLNL